MRPASPQRSPGPAQRRPRPPRCAARVVLAVLGGVCAVALSPAGCTGARQGRVAGQAASPLVWPPPPEQPRIAYVQSIGRPADAGVRLSGWGRFANWITGADKGNEPLVKPFGLALDENENLCLTDTAANAVCQFDRLRNKWHRWDRIGGRRFLSPVAVAARKGLIFVADSGHAGIIVFDSNGRLRFDITNNLGRPSGLVIVGERLFVADAQRHCVASFDLAGHYLSEFGRRGSGEGEFNFPTHLAADNTGNLLVTDSMNGRVQIFDADGRFKAQFGRFGDALGHFSRPKGVAVDSSGHVYVMDALFDNLQIFDQDGRLLLTLGESGNGPGQFWMPNGIAISSRNEIFIADSYNRRVQVFKYIGQP